MIFFASFLFYKKIENDRGLFALLYNDINFVKVHELLKSYSYSYRIGVGSNPKENSEEFENFILGIFSFFETDYQKS